VATMKELKGKPNIEYPCNWSYKVIGEEIIELEIAIKEITNMRDPKIKQTPTEVDNFIFDDIKPPEEEEEVLPLRQGDQARLG